MFGAAKTIAVQDADTVSRKELRGFGSHDPLEGTELSNAVPDEFGGNVRFKTIEFVVHRLERNVNVILMPLKRVVDGGRGLEYDLEHECHERGEQESALILFFGGCLKKFVELLGRQESLKDGTDKNSEGGLVFKAGENVGVSTHGDSFQMSRLVRKTISSNGNCKKFPKIKKDQKNYEK